MKIVAKPVEKPVNEYVERIVEVGEMWDLDTKNLCLKIFKLGRLVYLGAY